MKQIIFAALSFFVLVTSACTKSETQVFVRFQNTLEQDIDNARYTFDDNHNTDLGLIPAATTTDYFAFDYFEIGDGFPMGVMEATLEGERFFAYSGLWCGTGVTFTQLEPGLHTLVISKIGSDSSGYYQLKFAE